VNDNSVVPANEDKTVAVVAYLTLIGFIIAVVLNSSKKTSLGAYHLRQSLGLTLTWIALVVVEMVVGSIPLLGWLLSLVILPIFILGWVFLFVLWLTGLLHAINGQKKPIALLGSLYEQWFGNTFD
jgi:uncharacterized membrane protein